MKVSHSLAPERFITEMDFGTVLTETTATTLRANWCIHYITGTVDVLRIYQRMFLQPCGRAGKDVLGL